MIKPLITFDNSFFEDEVRDDFFVPSIMKRVWASQMEILAEVARVCDILGVTYFLAFGTLLGAVRHKGFIPWDDDIDICMKRKDYMKFLANASRYLPTDYEIKSIYSNRHDYNDISMWIVNTKDLYLDENSIAKHHGYPFRIGIDIFPLDALPVDEEIDAFEFYTQTIGVASYAYEYNGQTDEDKEQLLKNVEDLCNVDLDRNGNVREQLARLYDKVIGIYQDETATPYTVMTTWKNNKSVVYDRNCFNQTIDVAFEHVYFKAPVDYISLLKIEYGDFEKKTRSGGDHDYPLVRGPLRKMADEKGLYYGRITPDIEMIYKSLERYNRINNGLSPRTGLPENVSNLGKKILILCFSAKYWESLNVMYQNLIHDSENEVVVVALPYYRKLMENIRLHTSDAEDIIQGEIASIEAGDSWNSEGKYSDLLEKVFDIDEYPEYVNIIPYNELNVEQLDPDMIITNYPYDSNNGAITISQDYYSDRLLKYTDELVYVQYFNMADIEPDDERSRYNMPYYVVMPGVINADKVYVTSETMRREYIECLVRTYGEGTREFWKIKILVNK